MWGLVCVGSHLTCRTKPSSTHGFGLVNPQSLFSLILRNLWEHTCFLLYKFSFLSRQVVLSECVNASIWRSVSLHLFERLIFRHQASWWNRWFWSVVRKQVRSDFTAVFSQQTSTMELGNFPKKRIQVCHITCCVSLALSLFSRGLWGLEQTQLQKESGEQKGLFYKSWRDLGD